MSERRDLTRWNRAGLTRFRYVDGNAIEYLEILRQQLVEKFADPENSGFCKWLNPPEKIPANEAKPPNETLIQRQARLSLKKKRMLETYHQDRRDWAWEISRTFARACHILTEHADAYANEGYLPTATQWEHVRRLVEMLDYHPAPPASAATRLVLVAKDNSPGVVARGFQVKNSPPTGGDKVIFETLEDLTIDPALNELRPKDWNRSQDPAVPPADGGGPQTPQTDAQFSAIANGPVVNLQGVGETWAGQLDALAGNGDFRIKDFLDLDPQTPGVEMGEIRLREFKAKATKICSFDLEAGWSDITNWLLPRIAAASPESVAQTAGKSLDLVRALQLRIELIGAYLDQGVYDNTRLKDLLPPAGSATGGLPASVATCWRAKGKPKVLPGQVAMIVNERENRAEAATVDRVADPGGDIHLLTDQVDVTWPAWLKSDIALHVVPRWQRECWLNNVGIDVVRTEAPHGLRAGAHIGWKLGNNPDGQWKYAEVIDADTRNLKLKKPDSLPSKGTHLYPLRPIEGSNFPAGFEAVAIKSDQPGAEDVQPETIDVAPTLDTPLDPAKPAIDSIFTLKKFVPEKVEGGGAGGGGGGGGGLLPPASLPKIGSFLFPSPLLPLDLVKAAVELMLSIGVMVIPSTGEIVIKGMPFGGLLEDAGDNPQAAAQQLFEMLDKLEGTVQECDADGALLWKLEDGGAATHPDPQYDDDDYAHDGDGNLVPYQIQQTDADGNLKWKLKDGGSSVYAPPDTGPERTAYDEKFLFNADGTLVPAFIVQKLVAWKAPFTQPAETGAGSAAAADETEGAAGDEPGTAVPDEEKITAALTELLQTPPGKEVTALFQQVTNDLKNMGPLLAVTDEPDVQATVAAGEPLYMFNGRPEKIAIDDWVVGRFTDGLRALKVRTIDEYTADDKTRTFALGFSNLVGNEGELQEVFTDFRGELTAEDASVNTAEIDSAEIELEVLPVSLKAGDTILLSAEGQAPVAARIDSIIGNTIITTPPATGFTKGSLIIYGNVVTAGHGESQPAKILGSGDASRSNQEFTLKVEDVSFTPDATKRSGVAAAIEVEVAGRVWQQVSTLKDSLPGDHHYAIRMTEDGYVRILFGDGEHGRRLPSGKNNIRVRYRIGSGVAGNVAAGSLVKPVSPHPLVETVLQPLQAAGGGDMESLVSLRENAPSTLLALERAVSLADFSHLAASQSSIWQARAYRQSLQGDRQERVTVVIVPAGGVQSDAVEADLATFLQTHALPGVMVSVSNFDPVLFDLIITIRVNYGAFIAEDVAQAVSGAVADHFALQRRKLGQHLYLSEVYKIVEGVSGVENSTCEISEHGPPDDLSGTNNASRVIKGTASNGKKDLQVIEAKNQRTVIYLDPAAGSLLTVNFEEYQP
jgi:hypothetical protein